MKRELMMKRLRSIDLLDEEDRIYQQVFDQSGWSVVKSSDSQTIYCCHHFTGRIVELEFDEHESTTWLDIFDEFMKKDKTK